MYYLVIYYLILFTIILFLLLDVLLDTILRPFSRSPLQFRTLFLTCNATICYTKFANLFRKTFFKCCIYLSAYKKYMAHVFDGFEAVYKYISLLWDYWWIDRKFEVRWQLEIYIRAKKWFSFYVVEYTRSVRKITFFAAHITNILNFI
jgi:hypothetical protein